MKVLIPILIGLLVVGCGEVENGAYKHRPKQTDTNESTPTTNTNKGNGTAAKPVKELTLEEKVIGTYEFNPDGDTHGGVFLENGVYEGYTNGKKDEEGKWEIENGEIYISLNKEDIIFVFRINADGSITPIVYIDKDGERKDLPKDAQRTLKKIK